MKLTFCGAAGEVTGSCILLETDHSKILVDCGYFQSGHMSYERNLEPFPFDPHALDAVVVTHAHIDHIGRLPKLVKEGFKGRIFATHPTRLLCKPMWQDAATVMKDDARRHHRPLIFETRDIATAYAQLHGVSYDTPVKITDETHAVFREVGHIFGSAFVEMDVAGRKIVFSGDVGNDNTPILRDTDTIHVGQGEVVVLESTYGNRIHEPSVERSRRLEKAIKETVAKRGTLLIPAFSLERAQELLYELNLLVENGAVPRVPFFFDSPLAIRVLPIYHQFPELYDRDAKELKEAGDDFFKFDGLVVTKTPKESASIRKVAPPKVIIAGSGMMHGGRIMRHLAEYLSDSRTTVLVVGYQAAGTVGRALCDGAKEVTIEHDKHEVKAKIDNIGAYSAHADADKLVRFATSAGKPRLVILNHGEDDARTALAERFRAQGIEVAIPKMGESVEI
jgi:metallo-beta-lactamase family protein